MRIATVSALVLLIAACGTSSAPQASPSPTPPAPPSTPAPPTPPPHSGSGAAAGSAGAALLAIITEARGHKVRMTIETAHGGAQRPMRMVVEAQPPDRRHSVTELPTGTRVETVLIGNRGWSRMGEQPWRAAPPSSVAVGLAGADDMVGRLSQDIASGRVQVSEDPSAQGFRMFHIVAPLGVIPSGGAWDGQIAVAPNGLPDHMNGSLTGGVRGESTVHETFEYDESIAIEAPL